MTCAFLASKIEESPRKLRDCLHHALALRFKNNTEIMDRFAEGTRDYRQLYERILGLEKVVLVASCFDLTIDHPYRHLARLFKEGSGKEEDRKDVCLNTAHFLIISHLQVLMKMSQRQCGCW